MSDRTVAEDTLTPADSTTCWDPTGWAEPMYSVTTALRMAALRLSSSGCPVLSPVAIFVFSGRQWRHLQGVRGDRRPRARALALHSSEC